MIALGIDFGTSGARAMAVPLPGRIAITPAEPVIAESRCQFALGEAADAIAWQRVLWQLISDIDPAIRSRLTRIAINGTSATVLLCDNANNPLTSPLLYSDASAREVLPQLQSVAPADSPTLSPTLSATSSLAKALWWYQSLDSSVLERVSLLCHQADWLTSLLHGQTPVSDYHNALKLGYDVHALAYPNWLKGLPVASWLPAVKVPGEAIAPIATSVAKRFSIPKTCQICAGTTDSIAAFLASGASQVGEAVTSLGSTLVLKLLSPTPVDDQEFGIYSHRLGDLWLAGGASNTGGAVLQQYFSASELAALSAQIDISRPCALDYYPLPSPGERFPINDPDYAPRLVPRPESDTDFLYGMLDAIARIESEGYQKLQDLGASTLKRVYTAGGGAKNAKWQLLRARHLGVEVLSAKNTEAAYGTAKLALNGLISY